MNKITIILTRNHKKCIPLKVLLLFVFLQLFSACTNDTYDKHFNSTPESTNNGNLWEVINNNPKLEKFAILLKNYGYDKILSQTQAYTVFAPTNEALANLDSSQMNVKKELLENHIARYFITVGENTSKRVSTLNNKKIQLINSNGYSFFGTAQFSTTENTTVASNGIIHILDSFDDFFPNTWEFLPKTVEVDSITDYMYSFDELIFDPNRSVLGSIVDGQQTYLDSVFINNNSLLNQLGYINSEDSTYTMLVPSNEAWIEAYNRIKSYYEVFDKDQNVANTIQRYHTSRSLVRDLIFNNNTQASPKDSMISTSGNIFHNIEELFQSTHHILTSNGDVYLTNKLRHKALDSWHKKIVVEAEHVKGRVNTLSTSSNERVSDRRVSNGRILVLTPTTSSGNPTATFSIPNTLSSIYDIYCVFVSNQILKPNTDPQMLDLKPRKIFFNLSYQTVKGDFILERYPESTSEDIVIKPLGVDTVKVASDFKFPTAILQRNIVTGQEEQRLVTLKVSSNVKRSETTEYSRELLIDCILLIPKEN